MTTTTGAPSSAPSCKRLRHAVLNELLPVISHADYREADMRTAIRALWLSVPAGATFAVLAFTAPAIALPCALAALVSYLFTDWAVTEIVTADVLDCIEALTLERIAAGIPMLCAMAVGAWLTVSGETSGYNAVSLGLHVFVGAIVAWLAPKHHVLIGDMMLRSDAQRLRTLQASLEKCPASGCPACPWRQAPPQP